MAELWSWVLALVRQCNARLRPAGALQGAGVLSFLSSCHYKILISTAIAASVYPPDPCITALYQGLRTSNRMGVVWTRTTSRDWGSLAAFPGMMKMIWCWIHVGGGIQRTSTTTGKQEIQVAFGQLCILGPWFLHFPLGQYSLEEGSRLKASVSKGTPQNHRACLVQSCRPVRHPEQSLNVHKLWIFSKLPLASPTP